MPNTLDAIAAFLTEIDRLKLVERNSYVSDGSRHENSAEHSWHLALGLLVLARELDLDIDLPRALTMALIHDLGEIDAGDISVYDPRRNEMAVREEACIDRLAGFGPRFGLDLRALWLEFEAQQTPESRWVKILDRLLPFLLNLTTEGKSWKERGIARSQVMKINETVRQHAPEVFAWMVGQMDRAVEKGWLVDA